jgi:hypothetical protein
MNLQVPEKAGNLLMSSAIIRFSRRFVRGVIQLAREGKTDARRCQVARNNCRYMLYQTWELEEKMLSIVKMSATSLPKNCHSLFFAFES